MKWKEWLEKWSMTGLKISTGFLEMEWQPKDPDRDAAWVVVVKPLLGYYRETRGETFTIG